MRPSNKGEPQQQVKKFSAVGQSFNTKQQKKKPSRIR